MIKLLVKPSAGMVAVGGTRRGGQPLITYELVLEWNGFNRQLDWSLQACLLLPASPPPLTARLLIIVYAEAG